MPDDPDRKPQNDNSWKQWTFMLSALLFAAYAFASLTNVGSRVQIVSYSEIKQMIRNGEVGQALLEEHAITVLGEEDVAAATPRFRAVTPSQGDPELLPLLETQGVEITAEEPRGVSVLSYFLPWVLILAVYFWFQRRMMAQLGGGVGAGGLGGLFSGRFSRPSESRIRTTFADVAGQDQAKKEVAELVEFLREPVE